MVLGYMYYKEFKVTNEKKKPLSSVSEIKITTVLAPKKLDDLLEIFIKYKINKYFGLNIVEFMQMNPLETRTLVRIAKKTKIEDDILLDDILNTE